MLTAVTFVISRRPQLLRQHRPVQNGRGLIRRPPLHRGLCLLLHHRYHHSRQGTSICTFVLPAMRRSCPWRNSNIILSPITKRAGSPSNTASNDVFLPSLLFFFFPRACHHFFLRRSPAPGFRPSASSDGRSSLGKVRQSIRFSVSPWHMLYLPGTLDPGRSWNIPSY